MQTVVHVTHEAIQKIGGIGAVLQGMLTSRVYLDQVQRNILVGPYWHTDASGEDRLGPQGEVLYSSLDSLYRSPLASRFREIEQTFNVGIIYGRRRFVDKETGVVSTPEVLLVDVSRYDAGKIGAFKFQLWEKFGVESSKYEHVWDYEQWVRLAEPALAALHALGAASAVEPCVILSHEYMGIPTCLAAVLEGDRVALPHHLPRPRVRHHAPHRRAQPRPRHDVLQRDAGRDGPGALRRGRLRRPVRLLQALADQGQPLPRPDLRGRRLHAEGDPLPRPGVRQRGRAGRVQRRPPLADHASNRRWPAATSCGNTARTC